MGVDAVVDFVGGKGFEGAEEAIPDGKYVAVIGIGVRLHKMMMHFMHVW